MKKIAFFDIDGTLTSEIDGSISDSTIQSIAKARSRGNLMFINTGRCFQNVEKRFKDIGFDGYVCGCGTDIYCDGHNIFYNVQSNETTITILEAAQKANVDILFESRNEVCFDMTRPLKHPAAIAQYERFLQRGYVMRKELNVPDFTCDKFVIWYEKEEQLSQFRKVSDTLFECIDRGGTFREFVPLGFSKATGLQMVLDYYNIPLENAYALGDSNNDLTMLNYVPYSIAMGNSNPESLFDKVSYVTTNASNDGIMNALEHYNFI